jgi:D-serine deaminase-like pyridoxal phosphate-dependent protein
VPAARHRAERAHHRHRPPAREGLGHRRCRLDGDEPRPRHAKQRTDYGYGQVCTLDGEVLPGYVLSGANQEHGILSRQGEPDRDIVTRLPVGTQLRILPNHACATGAQFPQYQARRRAAGLLGIFAR